MALERSSKARLARGPCGRRIDMDLAYVRRWIVDMMGEDDERVLAWDRIVAEQLALDP